MNYAQIEKELNAVLFGCKRFHMYHVHVPYVQPESGRRIRPQTSRSNPQRVILGLHKYIHKYIIHRPGKDILVADILSRKSTEHQDRSLMESMEAQPHTLISTVPASD